MLLNLSLLFPDLLVLSCRERGFINAFNVLLRPLLVDYWSTILMANHSAMVPAIPKVTAEHRKSYLASQTQPLACCFDDRKCPKLLLAPTDFVAKQHSYYPHSALVHSQIQYPKSKLLGLPQL